MTKRKLIIIDVLLIILLGVLIVLVKKDIILKWDMLIYDKVAILINPSLTKVFKVITFFGSTIFITLITLFLLITLKNNRGKDFTILMIVTILINSLLKLIINRPRPDVLKLVYENTYSFPSGHTIAIFILTAFLIFYLWQEKGSIKKSLKIMISTFLVLIALLVMVSRIYLGAHYASDILGAILLGTFIFTNTLYFWRYNSPTKLKKSSNK